MKRSFVLAAVFVVALFGLTLSAADALHVTEKDMAAAEMGLSLAVLKYARYARGGRIPVPRHSSALTSTASLRSAFLGA